MRLRTTLTAGVLAVGVVLGGATTALAHGDDDHGRHHGYGYGNSRDDDRRHDYGRDDDRRHDYGHGRDDDRRHDYGRDDDRRHDYGNGYGRDDNRHHGYTRKDDREHGRDHSSEGGRKGACHMEGDTNANRGTHYQSDCGWANWHSASHQGY
ncbi:hypothetical protein [Streptomyces sp. YS-3]|uniref:hypothetical protein n=1 Tax=Streptomyces sp. YS-3 TaxID=3381352 RepID=UPI00386296DC